LIQVQSIRNRVSSKEGIGGFVRHDRRKANVEPFKHLPNALKDVAVRTDAQKSIRSGCHVKVRLLLVGEEGVRDPDPLGDLGTDEQIRDHFLLLERQSRIVPLLTEVKVGSEVLFESIVQTKDRTSH
jgi:hypothetical protein